jgi:hypothetical protein
MLRLQPHRSTSALVAAILLALAPACSSDADDSGAPGASGTGGVPATSATSTGAGGGDGGSTTGSSASASAQSSGSAMCMPTGEETCSGAADEDCDGTECALWARKYGGANDEYATGGIAIAPNGDAYIVGLMGAVGDSITFGGQTFTTDDEHLAFLAKLAADGQELWIRPLPTGPTLHGYEVIGATDSRVLVTRELYETTDLGGGPITTDGWLDMVVGAFDADDGTHRWSTSLAGPGESQAWFSAFGISPLNEAVFIGHAAQGTTYDGEVIVADPPSGEGFGYYGLAIDVETGEHVWHRNWTMGGDFGVFGVTDLGFGPKGDIYLTGMTTMDMEFGGPPLVPDPLYQQGFITHLDADGQWVDGAFICNECEPSFIAVGPSSEIVISAWIDFPSIGNIPNPSNLWAAIFHVDAQYQPDWAFYTSNVSNLEITSSGEVAFLLFDSNPVYLGADLPLNTIGIWDLFTGRLAMDGTRLWHRQFGGPDAVVGGLNVWKAFGLQPDGKSVVDVSFSGGPVDFGCGVLAPAGEHDVAVIQLAP